MELKHIDITKPLEAYDDVLAVAKREGREPNTGDRMLAMRAAIEAYEDDRKHVFPPMRGTGSQHDADSSAAIGERHITEETAKQYMEASLWAFIECAGNYPSIKPDARIWPHVVVYMPRAEVSPPVAPKGPFADYSAEEVEAYAREYAVALQALLSEILALAKRGMCHGLLADDYCSQIVAKIKGGA